MLELNKIYNMDCVEGMDKLSEQGLKVDCVFTSPPYNSKRFKKYDNFTDDSNRYFEFLNNVTEKMLKVSDKVIFNLQANYYNRNDVYRFIGEYHKSIQRIIIWNKNNPAPSSLRNRLTNAHEYFIIMTNGQTITTNSVFVRDVIDFPINTTKIKGHRAVMNSDVCDFFIKEFTNESETVLDPFMGSGTTAKMAIKNNRNFIGFELNKEYCDLANKRIDMEKRQVKLWEV